MPTRRASLSSGPMLSNPPRGAHRSTESSVSVTSNSSTVTPAVANALSYPPAVMLANPTHENAVHALITRLRNKLPCHSGLSLAAVEADESLQQTVQSLIQLAKVKINVITMAMTELLEKLSKMPDPGLDVHQSELYVLKVLSAAMNYRWNSITDFTAQSTPSSPAPASPTTSHGLKAKDSAGSIPWVEPPPLDEAVAKYTLSVMSLFLRQTASAADKPKSSGHIHSNTFVDPETVDTNFTSPQPLSHSQNILAPSMIQRKRPASATFLRRKASFVSVHSIAPSPGTTPIPRAPLGVSATAATLVASSPSINSLISKYAARVVFHLSAANWPVVFAKIRARIHSAANPSEDQADYQDIKLLSYCALDRTRLVQVFQELSSLLVNMKRETQHAVASAIRTAVWNWIDVFHFEFVDVIQSQRKLEGAPERVFDMFYQLQFTEPANKGVLWPTLTVLLSISPERLLQAEEAMTGGGGAPMPGKKYFLEILSKAMSSPPSAPKQNELAMVCYIDLCKAAIHIPPTLSETALYSLAPDLADDLRRRLMNPHQPMKPFYNEPHQIDVAFIADALVAIFRFRPIEALDSVFPTCLNTDRSDAVKTAAVRALYTLSRDAARLKYQPPLEPLYAPLVPLLRAAYQSSIHRSGEKSRGNDRVGLRPPIDRRTLPSRSDKNPTSKRYNTEPYTDRDYLILSIAALWRINLHFFLSDTQTVEYHDSFATTMATLPTGTEKAVFTTTANAGFAVISEVFALPREHSLYTSAMNYALTTIPATLSSAAISCIELRDDFDSLRTHQKIMHSMLHDYCEDPQNDESRAWKLSSRRVTAFGLAMLSLMITLTSSQTDISFSAATCLRYLAMAQRVEGAPDIRFLSVEEETRYLPAFEQLGDPKVRMIGRNAHQKRIRKIMRALAFPSTMSLSVWEECYRRWSTLTFNKPYPPTEGEDLRRPGTRVLLDSLSEDAQAEWKNLTLFLATFAGVCVTQADEIRPITDYFPLHLVPARFQTISSPDDMVYTFIHHIVDFLMEDAIFVREVAKEAVGSELNPRLYPLLFSRLYQIIIALFGAVDPPGWEEHVIIFVEQCISVLRLLFDRLESAAETQHINVDISRIVLYIAGFLHRSGSGATSLRIKVQFCGLCESVFKKRELLSLRKEALARNTLLDHLVDWVFAPIPTLPSRHETDGYVRLQNEVDMNCLKAVVLLLERLVLQPLDGSTGTDGSLAVSRLTNKYLNFFVRILEQTIQSEAPDRLTGTDYEDRVSARDRANVRDLAIMGISNMLSANTDAGLKHCLKLGYAADPRLRATFSVIFSRVLDQGAKFGTPEPLGPQFKRSVLCDMLRGDIHLALAVCETCPVAQIDVMIPVFMNIFDTRHSLLELLKAVIDREVTSTENEAGLFRRNSMCTKLLSTFAKTHGQNYLRTVLRPLIDQIGQQPANISFELDPRVARPDEDLNINIENLKLIAQAFLDVICDSISVLPPIFLDVCHHIAVSVVAIWPESKFAAVGAFIFLRFINPAIVSPDSVDIEIPSHETPEGKNVRRVLLLTTKIIQSLANNVLFGKEFHMMALNDFLNDNIHQVTKFLDHVSSSPTMEAQSETDKNEILGNSYDEADSIILHRFFIDHADKVGKELLSFSRQLDENISLGGKRTWDLLCGSLVDMGAPIGVPRSAKADLAHHAAYLDFMHRNGHRNTDSIRHIFVETNTPKESATGSDRPAVFILGLAKLNVETVDLDLLMAHMFQLALNPSITARQFDVIVDCTGFTASSELPMHWVKMFMDLVPAEILARFANAYILNPNSLAQKFLRKLYFACAGLTLTTRAWAKASVAALSQSLHPMSVKPLEYPISLETEEVQSFDHISRVRQGTRLAVTMHVGTSHLRIRSAKELQIWPSLECNLTEVMSLDAVGDVYNISTGQEPNEFIIRRSNYGGTIYFASQHRDVIVKTIRKAKSLYKSDKPLAPVERTHGFRDVAATLLAIALLNLGDDDENLRRAAYHLLCSVCGFLEFTDSIIVPSKGGFIPANPAAFAIHISDRLSSFAPRLTLDFLAEFVIGFDRSSSAQKTVCLQNLRPWIKNLANFSNPANKLYEHSGAKLRDGVRLLIDITIKDQDVYPVMQKCVWAEVAKLDPITVNIALDEIIRAAIDGGIGSRRCEVMADTLVVLSSINVRGRVLHKLRKTLTKTLSRPSNTLGDGPWNEVAALTRLCLVVCYNTRNSAQNLMFIPEIAYLITILAAAGHVLFRTTVHDLAMNMIQALYVARTEEPEVAARLKELMEEGMGETVLRHFGLARMGRSGEFVVAEGGAGERDANAVIHSMEGITAFVLEILNVGALHSQGNNLINVWRARWMALVASTSFQLTSYIQARSFIVMGALATSDVDDDLLYQMLVAFKGALGAPDNDPTTVVAMLRCITKVVPALPENSRYLLQMTWLAIALIQCSSLPLFAESCRLLQATLDTLAKQGIIRHDTLVLVLLSVRSESILADTMAQLDEMLRVNYNTSFSFSLASVLFKGLRHPATAEAAESTLRALLRHTRPPRTSGPPGAVQVFQTIDPDALGYFLALLSRCATTEAYRELLDNCGIEASWSEMLSAEAGENVEDDGVPRVVLEMLGMGASPAPLAGEKRSATADNDTTQPLLMSTFVGAMLVGASNDAEREILFNLLADTAVVYPELVALMYDSIQDKVNDAFANSHNTSILSAVSTIFRVVLTDPHWSSPAAHTSPPPGPGGSSSTFLPYPGFGGAGTGYGSGSQTATYGSFGYSSGPHPQPPHSANANGSMSTLTTIGEHVFTDNSPGYGVAAGASGPPGPGQSHLLALEELGMGGLVNPHQFLPLNNRVGAQVVRWLMQLVQDIIA